MKGSSRFKKLKLTTKKEDFRKLPSTQELLDRANATSRNEFVSELIASYVDAIDAEEVMDVTVTPETFGSQYTLSKFVNFKDIKKSTAPAVLAVRIVGSGENTKYQPLPLYVFSTTLEGTTSSFFITEWVKVFSFRDKIQIQGRTGSPANQNFKIVVLKDKAKAE